MEHPPANKLSMETFLAVQAALLNSECSPREAVIAALQAIANFAEAESVGDFTNLVDKAWYGPEGTGAVGPG